MKTNFSVKVRTVANNYDDIPHEIENILDEAADTLENHEKEVEKLTNRLKACEARYQNLYSNRQQLVKDFRLALVLTIILTTTIVSLGFYFI